MYDAMTADNMTYMCLKIDISISVFVSLLRGRVETRHAATARGRLRPPGAPAGGAAPRRARPSEHLAGLRCPLSS